MPTRLPDPLDALVGARIRVFRVHRKISQTDLADQIGVTFQQVQKYEKGTNRMGASRLQHLSQILQVPVPFFFEGRWADTTRTETLCRRPISTTLSPAKMG